MSETSPRKTISSNPFLWATVRWGAVVVGIVAVVGAVAGYLIAGWDGLWSALLGAGLAGVFVLITALSMIFANRWFGTPSFTVVFFGVVLGAWLVKLVLFLVVLFIFSRQEWVQDLVFFVSIATAVLGSLVVDITVMSRMKLPYVSDAELPESDKVDLDSSGV